MNRNVNTISARLSLRPPQRESLEILARICEILSLKKNADVAKALEIVKLEYPNVSDFERDFPSLCFALATGVGKTRLMGAFIAYLYQEKGIKHFFVLAPNLTIYDKLLADFSPGSDKYVLRGIEAFANEPPELITGDNYESGRGIRARDLFGESAVHINIFNISKINSEVRGGKAPRIKRLSEYIGESYFNYLSNLDDLVLLMDESHRYRAQAGMNAINELNPILGLELTATPQIESGQNTIPFKNVIYSYPLSKALEDGFVKEPTVATRENFDPDHYSAAQLEEIKLKDGVRIHESTKVELETYSKQYDKKFVKPFMLIVARDTDHAEALVRTIKQDEFFGGRYKDKVITVHSNQQRAESDDTVSRLLAIEDPNEETEIVVHVNMLKEGWDVTNLYTIVPLRAAKSSTLVEQSIGRGLRLPFGKRTGVKAVDRLTIVAHDKFQEIVDEANSPDSVLKVVPVFIGKDIAVEERKAVTVEPFIISTLVRDRLQDSNIDGQGNRDESVQQQIVFEKPIDREIAQTTLDVIKKYERLSSSEDLKKPEIQAEIVKEVTETLPLPAQASFAEMTEKPDFTKIVEKVTEKFIEMTIDIPKIVVVPKGESIWNYEEFDLDTSNFNLQPVSQEILLQSLQTNQRERLSNVEGTQTELVLENYLVKSLIDFDDVSYEDHSDLLYDLSGQAIEHLRSYLENEDQVKNVLQYHQKSIGSLIHAQMLEHQTENAVDYEVTVTKGFTTLRNSNYTIELHESLRDFRAPVEDKKNIRRMHFGYFNKCLYPMQKFDSDSERRFSIVLEDDEGVRKWFKPSKGQFQIFYHQESSYEPDFVVETSKMKFLCEVKRSDDVEDTDVESKAKAAVTWCKNATEHETKSGGKAWKYLLVPHDLIFQNSSFEGIVAKTSR